MKIILFDNKEKLPIMQICLHTGNVTLVHIQGMQLF